MHLRRDEVTSDRNAATPLFLSDEELNILYDVANDKMLYGEDEWVYGDSAEAKTLRSVVNALHAEARNRGFWWAK
jgi:hypothetical protein